MNEAIQSFVPPSGLSAERPFPGLRPFAFEDHAFFFGREDHIQALYRALEFGRFVAVVGSSGSGKSSLVRAGLLPLFDRENRATAGRHWKWVEMRPGTAALGALAQALAEAESDDRDPSAEEVRSAHRERIAYALRASSFGLAKVTAELDGFRDKRVVIVVDQFEELFRYTAAHGRKADRMQRARAEDEAAHFVQLLLEASRAPGRQLQILITMRSNFIGDCARFQGLPEAVSGSQFLVPSLARDQREQVITEPVGRAGATIDPGLVERLLNDVSDELDQLPVLQHCLKRLWEAAGKNADRPAGRHLTFGDYDAIGRIAGALSRHAEEVMASLPGSELAVEQAFRALAEFDRDGRIVRRALSFGQLLAETGVPEDQLRKVIDRFRADDCSFLLPPFDTHPAIAELTGIDVGHEALLRNWQRISAELAPDSTPQDPKKGWLRAEEEDGRTYRALLALVETAAAGSKVELPSGQVESRLAWWKARPRTRAWAERYGGGYDLVDRLLADSGAALAAAKAEKRRAEEEKAQAERDKARRYRLLQAAFAVCAVLLVVSVGALWFAIDARDRAELAAVAAGVAEAKAQTEAAAAKAATERAEGLAAAELDAKRRAEALAAAAAAAEVMAEAAAENSAESFGVAVNTVEDLMASVQRSLEEGRIPVGVALPIVESAMDRLAELGQSRQTPELVRLQLRLLLTLTDGFTNLGEEATALLLLDRARQMAATAPAGLADEPEFGRLRSAIYNRMGHAYLGQRKRPEALAEFKAGWEIDQNLPDTDPINLVNIADLSEPEAALGLYRQAIVIREALAAAAVDPRKANAAQASLSASHRSVGRVLRTLGRQDEALAEFIIALGIVERLVTLNPDNNIWQSNYSAVSREIADILTGQGRTAEALAHYEKTLDLRIALAGRDPTNVNWQHWLALAHVYVGNGQVAEDHPERALPHYDSANGIWAALILAQPEETKWRNEQAEGLERAGAAHVAIATALVASDTGGAVRAYRAAILAYERAGAARPDDLAIGMAVMAAEVGLGDALRTMADGRADAAAAYRAAVTAGDVLLRNNPGDAEVATQLSAARTRLSDLCRGPDQPAACTQ